MGFRRSVNAQSDKDKKEVERIKQEKQEQEKRREEQKKKDDDS